jgi:hypothetical protein
MSEIIATILLTLLVLPFIGWAWMALFTEIDDKFFAGRIRAKVYDRNWKKRREEEED